LQAALDYGGPRKEFFRLALSEIKKKYFDQGIREHLFEDYFMVGLIMGKAPCFHQFVSVLIKRGSKGFLQLILYLKGEFCKNFCQPENEQAKRHLLLSEKFALRLKGLFP